MLLQSKSLQGTRVRRADAPANGAPHGAGVPRWSRMARTFSLPTGILLVLALVSRANAADAVNELTEVVVTGSRIPAHLSTSWVPVTVLDRADLERGNPASVG